MCGILKCRELHASHRYSPYFLSVKVDISSMSSDREFQTMSPKQAPLSIYWSLRLILMISIQEARPCWATDRRIISFEETLILQKLVISKVNSIFLKVEYFQTIIGNLLSPHHHPHCLTLAVSRRSLTTTGGVSQADLQQPTVRAANTGHSQD